MANIESHYNKRKMVSAVDHVFDSIVNSIINGQVKPGDKLPTEMEFCQMLGVGRNSMREAIKKLEAFGIVAIRRAEGTFVSDSYNHDMLAPVLYGLLIGNRDKEEFIKFRAVMDIGVMFLACDSITALDMRELKNILEQIKSETYSVIPDVDTIISLDQKFHKRIADIVRSKMTSDIADYVNQITLPSRQQSIKQILLSGQQEWFINTHEALLDILERGSLNEVVAAITEHYKHWKQVSDE